MLPGSSSSSSGYGSSDPHFPPDLKRHHSPSSEYPDSILGLAGDNNGGHDGARDARSTPGHPQDSGLSSPDLVGTIQGLTSFQSPSQDSSSFIQSSDTTSFSSYSVSCSPSLSLDSIPRSPSPLQCLEAKKPPHSYAQMAAEALWRSERKQASLAYIFKYLRDKYDYFKQTNTDWQVSK